MLFVLGFAASAFAIHAEIPAETSAIVVKGDSTVTLSGELRFRGELRERDFDDDTQIESAYDGRVRLGVDVKVAPNASGFVQLENSTDNDTSDTYTWGQGASGSSSGGLYRQGNTKRGDLRILQAWVNWKPTDMLGVKVGHMPLALGNKIFFNHTKFGDDAILVYADPNKNLHLAALTIKFTEQSAGSYDDADAYVLLGKYKGGMFNVGADITYIADHTPSTDPNLLAATLTNVGVHGDIKVGSLTIWADGNYQTGEFEEKDIPITASLPFCEPGDCDISAYSFVAGVKIPVGPIMLAVDGGIGSGDDEANDSSKLPDDEFEGFITSLGAHGNAPLYTYVYDYRAAGAATSFTGGQTQNGISNTTFAAVRASGKATKNISWKAQIVYLTATEDVAIRGAVDPVTGNPETDDEIGIEFDGSVTIQLAKGLKYWIEGGYLSAGDAYQDNDPITNSLDDPDNAWAVRNGIALNF